MGKWGGVLPAPPGCPLRGAPLKLHQVLIAQAGKALLFGARWAAEACSCSAVPPITRGITAARSPISRAACWPAQDGLAGTASHFSSCSGRKAPGPDTRHGTTRARIVASELQCSHGSDKIGAIGVRLFEIARPLPFSAPQDAPRMHWPIPRCHSRLAGGWSPKCRQSCLRALRLGGTQATLPQMGDFPDSPPIE